MIRVTRILGNGVLVKLDPFKEVSEGGIQLITDNTVSSVRTGTVLMVGPGRYVSADSDKRTPVGLEPGEKIAFLRWHLEHKTGKTIAKYLGELDGDLGLLKAEDVLFAFHGNIRVNQ